MSLVALLIVLTLGSTFGSHCTYVGSPVSPPSTQYTAITNSSWYNTDMQWPLVDRMPYRLSSPFGPRQQASKSFSHDFHRGIDLPADCNTTIYAIANGTVRIACNHSAYTSSVIQITHADLRGTYYSTYLHIRDCYVSLSQFVVQGQPIGTTGQSEDHGADFEHLHFEIRAGGLTQDRCVNPLRYLPVPPPNATDFTISSDAASSIGTANAADTDAVIEGAVSWNVSVAAADGLIFEGFDANVSLCGVPSSGPDTQARCGTVRVNWTMDAVNSVLGKTATTRAALDTSRQGLAQVDPSRFNNQSSSASYTITAYVPLYIGSSFDADPTAVVTTSCSPWCTSSPLSTVTPAVDTLTPAGDFNVTSISWSVCAYSIFGESVCSSHAPGNPPTCSCPSSPAAVLRSGSVSSTHRSGWTCDPVDASALPAPISCTYACNC